jgi:hypothetical protein
MGCRTLSIDPQVNGRPLATRPIRDDDYLPIEMEDMEAGLPAITTPEMRYFVSATTLSDIGTFAREAQATYMFDKVRLAIEAGNTSAYYLYPLGREIQTILSTLMEQAAGRWGVYCGATQMIITYALFLLSSSPH